MIGLAGVTVALVVSLCILAYTLAVSALPIMLGVEAARWACASGSGLIGAGLVGMIAGVGAHGLLSILLTVVRLPILRFVVALLFAVPAAIAGYALVHGITRETVPSEIWRMIFCLIGGGAIGLSATRRLLERSFERRK